MSKALWENYTREEIQNLWEQSKSKKDFLSRLGYLNWNGTVAKSIVTKCNLSIKTLGKQRTDIVINYKGYAIQNLKNKTINQITVLDYNYEYSKTKQADYWNVKCSCGNCKPILSVSLLRGNVQSCGCKSLEASINNAPDLTNKRFGNWKVLYRDKENTGKGARWICECQCEKRTVRSVLAHSLILGTSCSCGCVHYSKGEQKIENELLKTDFKIMKQYNFKDLKNGTLRFDFAIFKNNNLIALIEYQGQQHYYPVEHFGGEEKFNQQKENDILKRCYCKDNNIKLIEIPYWDYDKINLQYLLHKINLS